MTMTERDLIYRDDLITAYDATHKGPPGGARKLMEDAPAVDAIPIDFLLKYQDNPVLRDGIHAVIKLWRMSTGQNDFVRRIQGERKNDG